MDFSLADTPKGHFCEYFACERFSQKSTTHGYQELRQPIPVMLLFRAIASLFYDEFPFQVLLR